MSSVDHYQGDEWIGEGGWCGSGGVSAVVLGLPLSFLIVVKMNRFDSRRCKELWIRPSEE